MAEIDHTLEEVLREFAKLWVDYERTPRESAKNIRLKNLIESKSAELEGTLARAEINQPDILAKFKDLIAECRLIMALENPVITEDQIRIEKKMLIKPWVLQRDPDLDADWRALAFADESYLRTALSQQACEPEEIEKIVAQVDQQVIPLRKKIQNAVGAAALKLQARYTEIFDALDLRLEILNENATSHLIAVPLCYVSCENIEGSKVKYGFETTLTDKVDVSFIVLGSGLSGQIGYVMKHAAGFDATAGETWAVMFEFEEQFLPARLLFGQHTVAKHTFISRLGEGTLRLERLLPEQWSAVRDKLEPMSHGGPKRDYTQVNTKKITTETISYTVEEETNLTPASLPRHLESRLGRRYHWLKGEKCPWNTACPGHVAILY